MVPKNSKLHKMLKRNPDRFQISNAKNTRFRNSAIIYMQKNFHKNDKKDMM